MFADRCGITPSFFVKKSFLLKPDNKLKLLILSFSPILLRGATTAEKLRGTKVWVPTTGRFRPAPGRRPRWVLGAGGGLPFPLCGSRSITPGKFLKTQMQNSAFW